jgi:hypothetical protein
MADFYCDHGAYASALGSTPTWGVPQEGDGSTKDAATASSIGSVLFGAVPTTGTISVCGVTISTTGVIGAASVGAAADALAANINAATTAVAAGVAIGTPQLRNLVYARGPTNGAPAGTCQIMMRVGSATLNYASNTNVGIATTFDGTPTLTQFVGGTGGCFGYMAAPTAMGVASSIAVGAYGAVFGATPYVDWIARGASDILWVRSGDNPTLNFSSAANLARSGAYTITIVIDTSTKWTTDSPGVITINMPMTQSLLFSVSNATAGYSDYGGELRCLQKGSLVIALTPSAGGGARILTMASPVSSTFSNGLSGRVVGVNFKDLAAAPTDGVMFKATAYGAGGGTFNGGYQSWVDCDFVRVNPQTALFGSFASSNAGSYTLQSHLFVGCRFLWNISGAATPPAFVDLSAGYPVAGFSCRLIGCSFSGWSAGGNAFPLIKPLPGTGMPTQILIEASDCSGLALPTLFAGLAYKSSNGLTPDQCALIYQRSDAGGSFRYENLLGVVDYDSAAFPAYPTLSATLPDGVAWSERVVWIVSAASNGMALNPPPLSVFYRGTAAVKTFTLNMMLSSALLAAMLAGDITFTVSYTSAVDGTIKTVTSRSLPAASGASWAGAGNYASMTAVSMAITTPDAVAANSQVTATLGFVGPPRSGVTESLFVDPALGVA